MELTADQQPIERRLRAHLEATEVRLRAWRRRDVSAEPAFHRDGNFVDAALQTMVMETDSADASRLAERARRLERALARLHAGEYGLCQGCEAPISPARLHAIPDAELCMNCQRARERSVIRVDHREANGWRRPRASGRRLARLDRGQRHALTA